MGSGAKTPGVVGVVAAATAAYPVYRWADGVSEIDREVARPTSGTGAATDPAVSGAAAARIAAGDIDGVAVEATAVLAAFGAAAAGAAALETGALGVGALGVGGLADVPAVVAGIDLWAAVATFVGVALVGVAAAPRAASPAPAPATTRERSTVRRPVEAGEVPVAAMTPSCQAGEGISGVCVGSGVGNGSGRSTGSKRGESDRGSVTRRRWAWPHRGTGWQMTLRSTLISALG